MGGFLLLCILSMLVFGKGDNQCYLTERGARQPEVALSFCQVVHPGPNCCLPGFDTDIGGYYSALVETSDLCASMQDESRMALRYLYCYACSPFQGAYMRTIGEFEEDSETFLLHEISICPSLVKKLYPEKFDECGLVVPATRENECEGDDTVVPSQYWGFGLEGALAFLNDDTGGKPPLFENQSDNRFVVVVAENGAACYGNSGHSFLVNKRSTLLVTSLFIALMNIISVVF